MKWLARGILVAMVLVALFAGLLARETPLAETENWRLRAPIAADPNAVRFDGEIRVLAPPSSEHFLGTDDRGRDVAARLVHGTRTTLLLALSVALLATIAALILGLLGTVRPWLDRLVLGFCDAFAAIPAILLVVFARGLVGGGVVVLVAMIALPRAASTARLVRERLQVALALPYCEAARALGLSDARIVLRHALPECFPALRTAAGLSAGTAVLSEVALSFLGLGVDSQSPSWGALLRAAHESQLRWWLWLPAGLCTAALAYSLLSEFGRSRVAGANDA